MEILRPNRDLPVPSAADRCGLGAESPGPAVQGTIAGGPGAQRGGSSRVLACDGGVGSGRTRVREAATTSRATGRELKQVNYDWRNARPSD